MIRGVHTMFYASGADARRLRATSFAAALLLAACGDDGSGTGPSRDAGTSDATGAGDVSHDATAVDAASTDTGSDAAADAAPGDVGGADVGRIDAGAPDATTASVRGGVTVFETRAPGIDAIEVGGVAAGFTPAGAPDPAEVVATFGACDVTAVAPDSSLLPDEPTLDAGDVTVSIGADTWRLGVEATDDGPRYVSDAPEDRDEFFADDDTVRATAAGGADVPAFSASVVAPAEPVITAPAWSALGDAHDRTQDLVVSWSGTTSGADVFVNILPVTVFPTPGIAEGNAITCRVADTGSTTVPAAALAMLPEGGLLGGSSVALTVVRSVSSASDGAGDDVVINVTASHTIVGSVD